MPTVDELISRKQEIEAHYLALPGVTAVDVGFKEVGGRTTDQLSIRVHVVRKLDQVPPEQRVPTEIDGIPTDVLERDYRPQVVAEKVQVAALVDTTHYTTLEGGISMGPSRAINGYIFAGTLGAIVVDNTTNQHAGLTNFHVACVDTSWNVGDRMVQPSRIDTGVVPTDEFGGIVRATLSSDVDGSVISIDAGRANSCQVAEIGAVRGTKPAVLGMAVRKRGRTTGLTYGSVDGISNTVSIDYGDGIGTRTLSNQVSIKADTTRNAMFSDHGDSGSVIVDDNGYVVALLFAGAGSGTLGNPIAAVLSELNISMCVGKAILKDLKDGRKDIIKDKDKELRKDLIADNKGIKDIVDTRKLIGDNFPHPGDPGPFLPPGVGRGQSALEARLEAIEAQLGQLTTFISQAERPDLTLGTFVGEPDLGESDLAQLRAALEQQAADAAAAKADFDTRMR